MSFRARHILLLLTALSYAVAASAEPITQLPQLNWPAKRSDWRSVKTDVSPAAVGDGVADDTAAIQAAIDLVPVSNPYSGPRGVYLPPGNYKITGTLHMSQKAGILLVGHGRDTTITWAGAVGGRMMWSDGAHRSRFVGIVWDGAGIAAVGFDHSSQSSFETEIQHRHEEFRNFTEAGVRSGINRTTATAEVHYQNCLFRNNAAGIKIIEFNDYDHMVQGCNFISNGYGVYSDRGNFNIYECHFEGSSLADIFGPAHAASVRRCTSVGSYLFFRNNNTSAKVGTSFENCAVDRWSNTTGAIIFRAGGPITVTDCKFTNPPNSAPPVKLDQFSTITLRVVSSGNTWSGSVSLVDLGPNGQKIEVSGRARAGVMTSASQSFFTDIDPSYIPAGTVFDAKTSFGAVGNGSVDDTVAIQNCINAARNAGNDALAYIPAGSYKITSALNVSGTNFRVGGIGWGSNLQWSGALGGPIMQVSNVQNVTIEALRLASGLANDTSTVRIRQSGTGSASSIFYDYIHGNTGANYFGGITFEGLGAGDIVRANSLYADVNAFNCSGADILINNATYGRLKTTNPSHSVKGGYFGFNFANSWALTVMDNQDLVIGDIYSEQVTTSWLTASGDGNNTTSSRITISGGGRIHTWTEPVVTLTDLAGRVFIGANTLNPRDMNFNYVVPVFNCSGTSACDFTLAGIGFTEFPSFNMGSGLRLMTYGNSGKNPSSSSNPELVIPENFPSGWEASSAAAFDDLAELGSKVISAFYVTTAYQKWAQSYGMPGNGVGLSTATAAPAGDGIANLLKFAMALNPWQPAATSLPVMARNGSVLEFSYTRSVVAQTAGMIFAVEWSDTLSAESWSTVGVSETILSDNGTVQQVKALVPMGSSGKRFVRLEVISPP